MFQRSQDLKYLEIITHRVKHEYLMWVEQFLDIIEEEGDFSDQTFLNDIGCNVGQFWKGLKRRNLSIQYRGYDIEEKYLAIACSIFTELSDCLYHMDVTREKPATSDISVVSATLEHFESLSPGLDHILETTKKTLILRTFSGDHSDKSIFMKDGADMYYYINQYSFLEILELFDKFNFSTDVIRDRYTDSMPKYLGKGIVRSQYVFVGHKRGV
jgi:hypothetical protein